MTGKIGLFCMTAKNSILPCVFAWLQRHMKKIVACRKLFLQIQNHYKQEDVENCVCAEMLNYTRVYWS